METVIPRGRTLGRIQSALTRIYRCEREIGLACSDVRYMRQSRTQLRCALTLLRKAAVVLGSIEHPSPSDRYLQRYAGKVALAVEQAMAGFDETIAEWDPPRATA